MIKFFGLIPRLPSLSREEFHDHYRHPHGTLGREMTPFRGYWQSHQVDSDLLGDDQVRFEAVAEVWFDTPEDAAGLADDPHFLRYVQPDEANFVDAPNLKWLYTVEEVVLSQPDPREDLPLERQLLAGLHLNRSVSTKILHFANPGADDPALPADLAQRLDAVRHVRSTPHTGIHADGDAAFSEVHELWWATKWDFTQAAKADPEALAALVRRPGDRVTLLVDAERFK